MQALLVEFLVRSTLIAAVTGVLLAALRLPARMRHSAWIGMCLAILALPSWVGWGPKMELQVLPVLKTTMDAADASPIPDPNRLPATPLRKRMAGGVGERAALGIYLAGLLLLLGRLAVGTIRANRLLMAAIPSGEYSVHASCSAPMTVGWFRPKILLPASWVGWSREQFDTVTAHERQHVLHRDPLAQWLGHFQRAVFWFHPLAWWLEKQLTATAEEACDEAVLAEGRDPREYSEHLLAIAREVTTAGGGIRALAMPMSGHCLPSRIRRILQMGAIPKPSLVRVAASVAACVIVAALAATGTLERRTAGSKSGKAVLAQVTNTGAVLREIKPSPRPAPSEPKNRDRVILVAQANPAPNANAQRVMPAPYRMWLEEDVTYIINAAERDAFLRLQSDPERNQFIEQFWLRRDPLPATAINEAQEEHYRRIGYANDRFSFGNTPGWKTDRGMTYIRLGPPDEREEHAAMPLQGQTASYATDMWRYRFINGVGANVIVEFVDRMANGEYRMTVDPAARQ